MGDANVMTNAPGANWLNECRLQGVQHARLATLSSASTRVSTSVERYDSWPAFGRIGKGL